MFEVGMDFIVKLFTINANTYFNNRKKSVIYFKGSRLKRLSVSNFKGINFNSNCSPLLGPFCGSEFWGFSLLKI
jgi:hypothetical protein